MSGQQGKEPTVSDYEALRATNIARNNARLRALGLISAAEEKASNDLASLVNQSKTTKGTKRKKMQTEKNQNGNTHAKEQSRKSLRLLGIAPDNNELDDDDNKTILPNAPGENTTRSLSEERAARVQECREIRLRRALEVSDEGAEKAAMENPTASYEHCLMRIQSMTEAGLANRVKSIERAAGRHCVVKMAIFKSCLQDEGLWDLAEKASAALERLKALKPPVN
jgi:hypothetical protein